MADDIKLTKLAKCAGCGAKVGAGVLSQLLEGILVHHDPNLLVGFDKSDDASVYKISDELALVQTVDFFPPIADDPYVFGQIAATNALSDVYAMGGEPKLCLNIMAVPKDMPKAAVHRLLQGGYEKAVEQAAENGAFCHNAYKGEALRQNEKGEIFVGSFDKCSSELPLADLAYYLRRYFKKTEGTEQGVFAMLENYGRHQPLSEGDLTILQGMLVYPEKFLRLVNEYYNKRRACVSPAMQERLAAAAREEEKGRILKDIIEKGC